MKLSKREKLLLETKTEDLQKVFKGEGQLALRTERAKLRKKYMKRPLTPEDFQRLMQITDRNKIKSEFPDFNSVYLMKIWLQNQNIQKLSVKDRLKESKAKRELKKETEKLIEEVEILKKEQEAAFKLKENFEVKPINIIKSSRDAESTMILLASDWHIEENVAPEQVNYLNEFNLKIAEKRVSALAEGSIKYIKALKEPFKIKKLVIGLLGDFISGTIHDDLKESNNLLPGDAIWKAQNMIASYLESIRASVDIPIEIVCATGNHGRMTAKQRVSTEQGNSLELLMYRNLAQNLNKFTWNLNRAYHTYVNVYNVKCRFHHGHALKYGGGVGGFTIPVNKAIAQWNKGIKADLDFFGHFHQHFDGNNFIANGCLVGFNEYAINIKASYEQPSQAVTLIDSERGKVLTGQIKLAQ